MDLLDVRTSQVAKPKPFMQATCQEKSPWFRIGIFACKKQPCLILSTRPSLLWHLLPRTQRSKAPSGCAWLSLVGSIEGAAATMQPLCTATTFTASAGPRLVQPACAPRRRQHLTAQLERGHRHTLFSAGMRGKGLERAHVNLCSPTCHTCCAQTEALQLMPNRAQDRSPKNGISRVREPRGHRPPAFQQDRFSKTA